MKRSLWWMAFLSLMVLSGCAEPPHRGGVIHVAPGIVDSELLVSFAVKPGEGNLFVVPLDNGPVERYSFREGSIEAARGVPGGGVGLLVTRETRSWSITHPAEYESSVWLWKNGSARPITPWGPQAADFLALDENRVLLARGNNENLNLPELGFIPWELDFWLWEGEWIRLTNQSFFQVLALRQVDAKQVAFSAARRDPTSFDPALEVLDVEAGRLASAVPDVVNTTQGGEIRLDDSCPYGTGYRVVGRGYHPTPSSDVAPKWHLLDPPSEAAQPINVPANENWILCAVDEETFVAIEHEPSCCNAPRLLLVRDGAAERVLLDRSAASSLPPEGIRPA